MPIVIKNFEWKESEGTLTIQVPLKDVNLKKADICISTRYIKISYEQYFFEVILLHPTDINLNRCTVTQSNVMFELFKKEKLIWEKLEPDIPKSEKQALKQMLIEEEHKRIQNEYETKSNKKHELKRTAVQEQICIDTQQRQSIKEIKEQEKNNALGNVKDWIKQPRHASKPSAVKNRKEKKKHEALAQTTEILVESEHKKIIPTPSPRQLQILEVDFTPREFPTPSRESMLEEENEWLRKQAEARRSAGFISDDIRPEERNPQFLKAKGDEFMKNQNYLGAVSAYSFGIKLSPKYADLYVARSAAHLAIGNFHKTATDCSTALELMTPAVPSNLKERAACIGRRGIALCKLGLLQQGVGELQASIKLYPDEYFSKELEQFEDKLYEI